MRTALIALATALSPLPAVAQGSLARTPDGHIDLQGVWITEFLTRTERPKEATTLEVTPEEARRIADAMLARSRGQTVSDPDFEHYGFSHLGTVNGAYRTSQIVEPADGKIPYSKAGRDLADHFDTLESYGFDNPEERPPYERCTSGILAAPIRTLPMLIPIQIIQTPDAFIMRNEDVQGVRIVPMGAPAAPDLPRFEGRGHGRWEGDTLVIETTSFRADDIARPDMGPPIVLSPETRITERFTRIGPDVMLYRYTVDDPVLYTAPWRAEYELRLSSGERVHEYACHEANHSMTNMLSAGLLGRQEKKPAN